MQKEDIVKRYFQAWLDKNIEPLENIFSDDIIYSYGPEYHGLKNFNRKLSILIPMRNLPLSVFKETKYEYQKSSNR